MIRVKDPKVSLDFYENVLGMELIDKMEGSDFTLYFLAYQHQKNEPLGKREAVLELTHNHGTENDPTTVTLSLVALVTLLFLWTILRQHASVSKGSVSSGKSV